MNNGQYENIYGVLCEIRDLLKAKEEKPTIEGIDMNFPIRWESSSICIPEVPPEKPRRGRPKKGKANE